KSTLTKREKRMLRWHMKFSANSGQEYISQLRGLGAQLAIPVSEGPPPVYKIVENKDLRPGAKLVDKDLATIQQIYWIDDDPKSVQDVLTYLGLRGYRPSRFVAFLPQKLEGELFNMERNHVEKKLRRAFDEDKIDETQFRVVNAGGSWKPELIGVSMRP